MGPDRAAEGKGGDRLNGAMPDLRQLCRAALARQSELPAIEFERRWYDWGELARVATSLQSALASTDAPESAPVILVARNHPAFIAALLALLAQGRTVRMVYAFQSAAGIAREIDALQACAAVARKQDLAEPVRQAIRRKGMMGIALDDMAVELLDPPANAWAGAVPAMSSIEILTSGTTGPPKRFQVSYELLERHFITTPLTATQGANPGSIPPFLVSFPLGNITGLYITLPTILSGQRIILLERFRLGAWLDYVKRYRPAHSGLPPSCVQELLDANVCREDLASLKALGVGAAPLDPTVQRTFEEAYGIPILISYGATEFAGPVTAVSPEDHARHGRDKIGTVGRALPGVRLRVVDPESGQDLGANADGVLQVVSPRIGPEWIRTSDLARIDRDGFLFILGRADGAINRGGFKVLPESVERALTLHPDISEAAVTGIPDRRLGAVPVAAIRLRPGAGKPSIEALEQHLREQVAAPSIPVKWLFCDDLPRTPSHKTDRRALQELFEKSD
ncbi:class I adenylate-forming enzyme family protein [Sphingomonas tabacisoli]|uniref:Class I adenylate-forming enzyme family protein n=1 Tax=Sphingomonas tabacisoli TaxID=2249466 RepID=A0ABW4I5S3_9SPHN